MIPTHIVIHHSLTADGKVVDTQAIRRYHMETNGWKDIGYHSLIELINNRYEVLLGRMWTEDGAHCKENGMNRCSLGICVVGNFDQTDVPEEAFKLLVRLVNSMQQIYNIPVANVKRHSEYATYKSCPGTRFPWDRFIAAIGV